MVKLNQAVLILKLQKRTTLCTQDKGEQESSPDVVTGMLQVLSINVYTQFDPDATLYFVTPLVAMKFDVLPDV